MTEYEALAEKLERAREKEWEMRGDPDMARFWRGARAWYEARLGEMTVAEAEAEHDGP